MNDAYDPLTGFIHCTNGGIVKLQGIRKLLFDALLRANGRPLTRNQLIEAGWGHKPDADAPTDESNALAVHVHHLARKITGCSGHIKNVWGVGYQLEGKFDVMKPAKGLCPCCGQEIRSDDVQ